MVGSLQASRYSLFVSSNHHTGSVSVFVKDCEECVMIFIAVRSSSLLRLGRKGGLGEASEAK